MKNFASTVLGTLFTLHLTLSSLLSVQAQNVTITGEVTTRPAVSFSISIPSSATAGQPFAATITALAADGLPTTNVTQNVTLSTFNGGTISPLSIAFSQFTDDGVWNGQITLTRAGDDRVIQASSGSATGSATIDIVPGALIRVEVTPDSMIIAVGEAGQFSASGFDQYENAIFNLDFVWSIEAGGGTIDQTGRFTAGTTAGTFTDTVRATATEGQNSFSDTASVTVTGGGIINQIQEIVETVRETILRVRETLRQSPVTQTITDVVTQILAPIAATTTTITAIAQLATVAPVLVSIGDAFLYTSYLWSVLLELLGLKRRRRPWGVVYNAQTKEPIPLVVVQLVEEETAKLIEQRVTDPYGRFGFLVEPGNYRIIPIHPRFKFPSKISPGKGDLRYTDLYHGEQINIQDPNTVLALNIPLDPVAKAVYERASFMKGVSFRRISLGLLVFSVLLQGLTVFLEPSARNIAFFAVYTAVLVTLALLLRRGRRTWGVVFDAQSKKELANAQVFVTQNEDPRFASRKITDQYGRFYLLLPQGTYRLAVQHPDYQFPGPREAFGYKGEDIPVTPKNPLVHVDIPVAKVSEDDFEESDFPALRRAT